MFQTASIDSRVRNYWVLFALVILTACSGDPYDGPASNLPTNNLPGSANPSKSSDVNLVVTSFAIDTELTPGAWETVSAIIQNTGSGALAGSGHIDVGYFLSTDDEITVDDIYLGDTSIGIGDSFNRADVDFGFETLSAGENYQFDHQLAITNNLAPGQYYVGAIVDYIEYYEWYSFPRATDTKEYAFPEHVTVAESDETDNVRVLSAHQVSVSNSSCTDDIYEPDSTNAEATLLQLGQSQNRNFCRDNSDWLQFEAIQGNVYKISTETIGLEVDTQLILYDTDGASILLFHDNIGNDSDNGIGSPECPASQSNDTVDLGCGWPSIPRSELVWEAQVSGTYFIKVRTTHCDEDLDDFCESIGSIGPEGFGSPDGAGLDTQYRITLQ